MSILVFFPFFELWTSSSSITRFLGMLRFALEFYLVETLYKLKAYIWFILACKLHIEVHHNK
jgi:hypothetical protein